MNDTERFSEVFEELKGILEPHAEHLIIQADTATTYYLDTPYTMPNKKPLFFGAVQVKKNYVSFHFMPVYMFPALLDTLSPKLRQRMQGKSCFNFKAVDQPVFDELRELTARGLQRLQSEHYL